MSQDVELPVEKLLSQMAVQQPSTELDSVILEMTGRRSPDSPAAETVAGFGWQALAVTSLVSVLVGTSIGWWIPNGQAPASVVSNSLPQTSAASAGTPALDTESSSARSSLRESDVSPLHGQAAQVTYEGFHLRDDIGPSRTYRLKKSSGLRRDRTLPVRKTAVIPSQEI
jgi:hypothetical protein